MKHSIIFLLILNLCSFSCQQKQTDESGEPEETPEVAALRQKVIDVHDEAMPLMSDIYTWKSKLKEQLEKGKELNENQTKLISTAILALDSANQGMRVWMREFSAVKTVGVSNEEALRSLDAEMIKIQKVKNKMIESMKMAEEVSQE